MHHLRRFAAASFLVVAVPSPGRGQQAVEPLVERIAARLIPSGGPGCTIGVSQAGAVTLVATGFADLERRVPMSPASILEAGSVSKQFTAAAVVLLALDGKLTLDDDIRRWFPELPDYGARITIRHLLTHTSGLRDWGSIAAIEGWPRGTRAYTNAHVLEIAARQRALNHAPGAAYSYTNTGYNLLALLVQRASGQSFADFTRDRIFQPLGMSNTSWRDDHQRLVPGRALAYRAVADGYATDMPNEHAHGNGGLLTTVRDLARWNDAMDRAALGQPFADSVVRRYVLTSGRTITYALGINVVSGRGTREITHSGATGGYRSQLVRFPERQVSIGVLCNGGHLNAGAIANQIADSLLPPREPVARPAAIAVPAEQLERHAGVWVHEIRRTPLRITTAEGALRAGARTLRPIGRDVFSDGAGRVQFDASADGRPARMVVIGGDGDSVRYRRESEWRPDAAALAQFTGRYASAEVAGEPFTAVVENGALVLRQRPDTRIPLLPAYRDAFTAGSRIIWFERDASGAVVAMHSGDDRAWDVAFARGR